MHTVTYEVKNHVGVIIYSNPPLNILTMAGLAEIQEVFRRADRDPEAHVILYSMPMQKKVFCAGMDLDEMLAYENTRKYCDVSKEIFATLQEVKKPTIYVYDGIIRGGAFEMSLFADFRFCGEATNIALPEITIGIIPGGGGTQTLTRLVGEAKAKEIILTGRALKSDELKELNIVNAVYPSETLLEDALFFAQKMAMTSPLALQAAKRAIQEGRDATIEAALRIETSHFVENFHTHDAHEGIAAFREKRQPCYQNK
ncbi:enoyl-CoA hydratase/isomerase family protein [Trichococcus sp. K1Tr]|uniref:enoyl-CoA hydratase/isomerase family protein n=1 Tax=Trichococcus sp. K1Tr TaxID=3020847 RepID=UPI00232E66C1|nr:enoyl-CoA hydratase/isomerase family protein [Trichococcus sp. K1Tr]MDB6352996.1 enoyl-CoA hydratase/isomerase family protein [Trichococcus sp. K1Tr]